MFGSHILPSIWQFCLELYICGIPILPVLYHDIENSSAVPINRTADETLSWCPHIKRSTPTSHARTFEFLVLVSLFVRVFMQINKAFYLSNYRLTSINWGLTYEGSIRSASHSRIIVLDNINLARNLLLLYTVYFANQGCSH